MRGYIYEITQSRLDKEDWACELDLESDNYPDYFRLLECDEDDGSERLEAIEHLKSEKWFDKVFEATDEPDVFVLKSGVTPELINCYHERIQSEVQKLVEGGKVDTFKLREAIDYPFGGNSRYLLTDWCGGVSEPTRELLEMLVNAEPGAKIYVNSVFDYKW